MPQTQLKPTPDQTVEPWSDIGPETAPGRFVALALVLAVGVAGAMYFAEASASAQARALTRHQPAASLPTLPAIVDAGSARIGFAWPRDLRGATLVKAGVWIWDHRSRRGRWELADEAVYRDGAVHFAIARDADAFPSGARFSFRLWVRLKQGGRTQTHLSENWLRWFAP